MTKNSAFLLYPVTAIKNLFRSEGIRVEDEEEEEEEERPVSKRERKARGNKRDLRTFGKAKR